VLGEDYVHKAAVKSRSVISIKKDQATDNRPSTTQGRPKKVAEAPFKELSKEQPTKEPLFPSQNSQKKLENSKPQSKSRENGIPIKQNLAKGQAQHHEIEEKHVKPRKLSERKPLKQQVISAAFKDSMIEGVGIYVNYETPEEDVPERQSNDPFAENKHKGGKPNKNQDRPSLSDDQESEGALDEPQIEEENKNQEENKNNIDDQYELKDQDDYPEDPEIEEVDHASIHRNLRETNDDHTPITGTHRTEIDVAEIEYNPHSFRQIRHHDIDYEERQYGHQDHTGLENLRLQQEYVQHQKIIEYQNARIEGLMHQINSLSSNLNLVLNKAAYLEQNVFQLTCQAQKPLFATPGAFAMPPMYGGIGQPMQFGGHSMAAHPGTSQATSFMSPRSYGLGEQMQGPAYGGMQGSFASMPSPAEEIEQVRRLIALKSKEVSDWQLKRADEERKLKDKVARIELVKRQTLQPEIDTTNKKKTATKITGENTIQYREREKVSSKPPSRPDIPKLTKPKHAASHKSHNGSEKQLSEAPIMVEDERFSFSNQRMDSLPYSIAPGYEPPFHKADADQEAKVRAHQMKLRAAKTMNVTLARILDESEYRRLLDFLSDKENLKNIGMIDLGTLELLAQKITDMLSYKAEAYVEECLPWIAALLHTPGLVGLNSAQDLLYVVKMVLGTDKRRKLYQHHVVIELQQLKADLEEHVTNLQRLQFAPRVY
jgi:hypothetical protein